MRITILLAFLASISLTCHAQKEEEKAEKRPPTMSPQELRIFMDSLFLGSDSKKKFQEKNRYYSTQRFHEYSLLIKEPTQVPFMPQMKPDSSYVSRMPILNFNQEKSDVLLDLNNQK